MRAFAREVIDSLMAGAARTKDEVHRLKVGLAAKRRLRALPTDAEILRHAADEGERALLLPLLRTKPTRSLSGVTVVAVQTAPHDCPHGTCIFCPGGESWGTAKAYTGREPAALRAARHAFDAAGQVAGRLAALEATGHPVDKVELIIQGGTFPALASDYQQQFVAGCLAAMNCYESYERHNSYDAYDSHNAGGEESPPGTPHSFLRHASGVLPLADEQLANERALARCIGLTIETKPDWGMEQHVDRCLELGATRIELGVQTTFDEVLSLVNRGHTVADTVRSTRVIKDSGLKLCYHMMPGLPGSTTEKDLASFRRIFDDPGFRPDKLKIYPTLVIPGTPLHALWKRGQYTPLTDEDAARLIADVKAFVPPWVRIMRVDRDIPTPMIAAGVKHTNLRQIALAELKRRGNECRCIRCREAGHRQRDGESIEPSRIALRETTYDASGGVERFLEIVEPASDALVAFLRLREPSPEAHRPEMARSAVVRELRVLGVELPLGSRGDGLQHRGHGRRLMSRAEEVARDRGFQKLLVMSGIGVRPYYRKLGYERDGPYVGKRL